MQPQQHSCIVVQRCLLLHAQALHNCKLNLHIGVTFITFDHAFDHLSHVEDGASTAVRVVAINDDHLGMCVRVGCDCVLSRTCEEDMEGCVVLFSSHPLW